MPSRNPGRKREREECRGATRVLLSFLVTCVPIWCIILQQPNKTLSQQEQYHLLSKREQLRLYGLTNTSKKSNVSTTLAYQQSFGFFDDIPDAAWKRIQARARTTPLYSSSSSMLAAPDDNTAKSQAGWWYAHNLLPVLNCFNMERVGGLDDGPKWTCDPYRLVQRPNCLIYSIGSAGQYQWEQGLVQRLGSHCEIHVFE